MSYPSSQYPGSGGYTPPSGSPPGPRRNLGMLGAVVIVCTAVVLGSVLTVTYLANRGSDPGSDGTPVADGSDDTASDDGTTEEVDDDAVSGEGDPEQIAVTVIEIMYGLSDEDPAGLICSDPGVYLNDLESMRETMTESLGDVIDLIEEIVAMDSYEEGETMQVEIGMVYYGTETSIGTVELIVEEGSWRACDFAL